MLSDDVAELRQALGSAEASREEQRVLVERLREALGAAEASAAAMAGNEQGFRLRIEKAAEQEQQLRLQLEVVSAREQVLSLELEELRRHLQAVVSHAEELAATERQRRTAAGEGDEGGQPSHVGSSSASPSSPAAAIPDLRAAMASFGFQALHSSAAQSLSLGLQEQAEAAARARDEVATVAEAVGRLGSDLVAARSDARSARQQLAGALGRLDLQKALLEDASARVAELEGDLASAHRQVREMLEVEGIKECIRWDKAMWFRVIFGGP